MEQAGAQSYGYAVFLMNDKAVDYLKETHGWEIGVGPTVVVVDEGAAKNLSTSTLKEDAYAFIFDQEGLMAGVALKTGFISPDDKANQTYYNTRYRLPELLYSDWVATPPVEAQYLMQYVERLTR